MQVLHICIYTHALYPKLIILLTINLGIDILTFSGVYLEILSYIADNIIILTAIKYTFNIPLKYFLLYSLSLNK